MTSHNRTLSNVNYLAILKAFVKIKIWCQSVNFNAIFFIEVFKRTNLYTFLPNENGITSKKNIF